MVEKKSSKARLPVAHHFIDEAGDMTLFDKSGRSMIGSDGVSRCFMVGALYLPDPSVAHEQLNALRAELLNDPFLRAIPSMNPSARKTALFFHAKDDCPEVRHQVFRLIRGLDASVFVGVRRKSALLSIARDRFQNARQKLHDHEIYDDLIKRVLRNRLHLAEANKITIAVRGTRERKKALREAVARAMANFKAKFGDRDYGPTEIETISPSESGALQVTDYFLWALQRVYERSDDRYFSPLKERFKVVMDLDDTRRKDYGEWYSKSNPLEIKKLMPVTG